MRRYFNSSSKIVCPYFLTKARRSIRCEGVVDKCYTELSFRTDGERADHEDLYCECNYNECPIAKANNEKWDKFLKIYDDKIVENKGVISNAGRRF